jgi:alpha-D-xyloside xylohydrolase
MGFLTSHSRSHGAPPTEPWLYNDDFVNYYRACAEMKYQLMPYIYTEAKECTEKGLPMFRALLLEFPDDAGAWDIDDQYMFGSQIMVAPLFEEGYERNVYLPGNSAWTDYQTGDTYQPGWHKLQAKGQLQCIILVRDGAVLPLADVAQSTDRINWDTIKWVRYGSAKGRSCYGHIFFPGDKEISTIEIK